MKKILLVLVLLLTGCQKEEVFNKNLFYMDTLITIKVYTKEKNIDKAINEIEKLYSDYHNLTNFYENSELTEFNNGKNNISPELKKLIDLGLNWNDKTNGLFNINIGELTKIWHDFRISGVFPDLNHLKTINTDSSNLYNKEKRNVDLGAIVKGYVTELAGKKLEQMGFDYYIINAGGNVKVGKSYKGHYNIGIASPVNKETFYTVKGENISVVTSGGYERFYEYNKIKYHHIIDPFTKLPANNMKSVTVIGSDSTLCDILSTSLFLMDLNEGALFIKDYDVDVIWFTNNDEVIKSEGFRYE